MEWSDEAIVLSVRRHGESSGILEALTRSHGRHLGLVRGGSAPKGRALLQSGNRVKLTWLNAFAAVAAAVLPEREPHLAAFERAETLLDTSAEHDFQDWAPFFVLWELGLLDELGFGLDLTRCAANGTADDLIYVSPRTGRAVSRQGGEAYRDRLLVLPAFLLGRQAGAARAADLLAGLQLTAHFLTQWVLAPHDKTLPEARTRLTDLAVRTAESA